MNDRDADQDEMGRFFKLSEQEIDELFSGVAPPASGNLEELAELLAQARSDLSATPDKLTESRHLAAIVDATQLVTSGRPACNAAGSAIERDQRVALPWRNRPVFNNRFSSLAAQLSLAGGIVVVGLTGTAYAGALPGPVQRAVADAAHSVGLSLPGASNDINTDDGGVNNTDDTAVNNVDEGAVNNVDEGAVNNVDEGAVNNVDDNGDNGNG